MVEQGVALYDRLVVAVGINPDKRYTFSLEDRLAMLRGSLKRFRNLSVTSFSNLYLIDYAQQIGATHMPGRNGIITINNTSRSAWRSSTAPGT